MDKHTSNPSTVKFVEVLQFGVLSEIRDFVTFEDIHSVGRASATTLSVRLK